MIKNLKLLRNEKGISQQRLANVLGLSQQSINKYENHSSEPDINTLIAIADYFDTSVDYLLGYNNERELKNIRLKPEEETLIRKYRKLSAEERVCIDTLTDTYISRKSPQRK